MSSVISRQLISTFGDLNTSKTSQRLIRRDSTVTVDGFNHRNNVVKHPVVIPEIGVRNLSCPSSFVSHTQVTDCKRLAILTEESRDFPQSVQVNARIVSYPNLDHDPFLPYSFLINHLTILR